MNKPNYCTKQREVSLQAMFGRNNRETGFLFTFVSSFRH